MEVDVIKARKTQVNLESTSFSHCIFRCVCRVWLCEEDLYKGHNFEYRRQWVLDQFRHLSDFFVIDICVDAIMSIPHHFVSYVEDKARGGQNVKRFLFWTQLYKGHLLVDRYLASEVLSSAKRAALSELIEEWRLRSYGISWFMCCLNEFLADKSNGEIDARVGFLRELQKSSFA
jgi:hypothetical protein